MSGRNNRIVRNREKNIQFSWNMGLLKIGVGILFIILVLLGFWRFWRQKNEKKIICLAEEGNISQEYFILSSQDQIGIIDKKGNQILEPQYTGIDLPNPSKDVFIVQKDEKKEIFNSKGEKIFTNYEQVEAIKSSEDTNEMESQVLKYKKENLYGLLDLEGNIITEPIYTQISSLDYRPGRILVEKEGKYGILDAYGNIVIEPKYDQILADGFLSNKEAYGKTGYIVAQKKADGIDFGYIDYTGNLLLDTKYEALERALEYDDENIYLIAMQKGKKGVFKNKKKMIDLNFQNITYSNLSKVFVVNKNGKYGFFNLLGKVILKPEYTQYAMAGNYICVTKDDKTQLFDSNGNLVGTNSYTKMIETNNPAYFIAEDEEGYYSIISKEVKIDEKYVQVAYAFNHYFIVTDKTGKAGVINALTKEMEIDFNYDFILLIEGTKSLQAVDGMNDFVDIYDKDLRKTVTVQGGIVENIGKGYSICYGESEMKYINQDGQVVENTQVYPDKKTYSIQQNGKWGFADDKGNLIVKCEYDMVTEFNPYGFAGIRKNGKWGVVKENGEVIAEPTYELDTYYFPQFIGKYRLVQSEVTYCEEVY